MGLSGISALKCCMFCYLLMSLSCPKLERPALGGRNAVSVRCLA